VNISRVALAAVAAFIAYFVLGSITFSVPALRNEFLKYPAVYRGKEGQMSQMPVGMVAMFLAMVALALLYAKLYRGGSGFTEGASFGALIAFFALGAFVLHNYVNLNIGLKLMLVQAVVYSVSWIVTGIVIGLIYRPLAPR
jgi:Protein of unknown function (DUF1761)